MKLVIIESPFAGDVERNTTYLKAAMLDSLRRGESPFASHGPYTQVLDDTNPEERHLGIHAGFAWGAVCDLVAVYTDLGISEGMRAGIEQHTARGKPVQYRSLPTWKKQEPHSW